MLMRIVIEGIRKVPQPQLELIFSAYIWFVFGSIIDESSEVTVALAAVGLHRICSP